MESRRKQKVNNLLVDIMKLVRDACSVLFVYKCVDA